MSFEQALLYYASPALCGIKPACLFSMQSTIENYIEAPTSLNAFFEYKDLYDFQKEFNKQGRKIVPIKRVHSTSITLFFIYDERLLYNVLNAYDILAYLKQKGYTITKGPYFILQELFSRLALNKDFPHEVGLFLGYPLEDVIAFENDKGHNSKYTGYWQVYGNVNKAYKTMQQYKACSIFCRKLFNKGIKIPTICKSFSAYYKHLEVL